MQRAILGSLFSLLITSCLSAAVPDAYTQTAVTTTGGTSGYLPRFTGAATLGNSEIYNTGSTVGIGVGTSPNTSVKLDIGGAIIMRGAMTVSRTGNATASAAYPSYGFQFFSNAYNSSTKVSDNPYFTLQSEPTGNNTSSPSATFNLLFANNGGESAETGFYINPDGTLHFASAQTFPIPAGAEGPKGMEGPRGTQGPQGAVGPMGPTAVQNWRAVIHLPATIVSGEDVTGPPTGSNNGLEGTRTFLTLPQSCTAANFSVSTFGAANASTVTIEVAEASSTDLVNGFYRGSALGCTLTANKGQPVSCTSGGPVPFSTPDYLSILFTGFSNPSDFENATALVSFTCH